MCDAGASFITIGEAAKLLETTEMRILMMLRKHELQGKMENETWHVDLASLNLCEKPAARDIVKPACGSGCAGGCGGI